MNRNYVVGGVLVAGVLLVVLGGAFYTGLGPAPGGSDSSEPISDFPTATPSGDESGDSGTAGSTGSSDEPPFSFTVDEVEECGQTCRDVTATLDNDQNETASGITVYTRIFAGENNTDADDVVWEGTDDVGTLEAGGSHTTTVRVELSFRDGLKIDRNDGWITILTTVESDEETVTSRDSEQVA